MSVQQQPPPRHWYNDKEVFLHGFVRSNYITAFTDWFMSLAGKATELVLYGTVLYSCAQLYPGVNLPTNISLVVFLVQMGALDIGGLSLGKLAKQAREDGNRKGAEQAATLSKWLIGIMLAGVVTVGIEHVIPLNDQIQTGVQLVLVVGRSFCAVLYGRVVHDLKTDSVSHQEGELTEKLTSELTQKFRSELTLVSEQMRQELASKLDLLRGELTGELTVTRENQGALLASLSETIATHERMLAGLNVLPAMIERVERQMRTALQEMRTSLEASELPRPKLSLVASPVNAEKLSTSPGELTNKEFIEGYLSKHPEAKNVDVIVEASKQGLTISQSQVSQIRKTLKEQSA